MKVDIIALDRAMYRISQDPKLKDLVDKYGYEPRRRYENVAGSKPMSSAQTTLIIEEAAHRYLVYRDLLKLIRGVWEMDADDWTSADAMFIINVLKAAPLDPIWQDKEDAKDAEDWAHQMPYEEYLDTSHWRNDVRPAALERADYKCQLCGVRGTTLHVHHNTYENLGDERPTDLIVLCGECHDHFHQWKGRH